jgi:4-hydroxy-tetrahydrodipicolinate reductase
MGSGVIRLLEAKAGVRVVGVYGRRARERAVDAGVAAGLGRRLGFDLSRDLDALLEQTRPHVAIQATCSTVREAEPEISTLLRHGVNVISIAEEMAFPAHSEPAIAAALDDLARRHGATLVGTGINPGFVLDLLIIALSGVCQRIETISARRINDLAPYGPTVLASQGVGLTPGGFAAGIAAGRVVGHFGFPESLSMIGAALGWRIERIEQSREPIVSSVRRETPFVVVEPGCVAGCLQTAVAWVEGRPAIRLVHPQQIHPQLGDVETGDFIDIAGEPNLHLAIRPEIPGGIGTVSLAVNLIPRVLQSEPGLRTMADLPLPAAVLGDMRAAAGLGYRERS